MKGFSCRPERREDDEAQRPRTAAAAKGVLLERWDIISAERGPEPPWISLEGPSVAPAAVCACFLFHRRSRNASNNTANKPSTPPTTPPTIFPVSEPPSDELAADVVEVDNGNWVPLVVECPELEKEVTEEPVDDPAEKVVDEKLVVEDIEEDDVVEGSEDVGDAVVVDDDEDEDDVSDWVEVTDTALVGDEVDVKESG
jgi:hypothetical protein